ncbi:MAG TPA: hypothetical protein VLY23_03425 [Candidatus Acidoferrum sp.]|nr:hypothetical protein [Candidatus Acidoferrum sp.]
MMIRRLLMLAAVGALIVGMSPSAVRADSTGTDPQGKFQSPVGGGTPGVGEQFNLTFGVSDPSVGCTASTDSGGNITEDCIAKNLSGFNWTSVTISSTVMVPCSEVTVVPSDLFTSSNCTNNDGGTQLNWWGVNYSTNDNNFLAAVDAEASLCNPHNPLTPTCTDSAIQESLDNVDGGLLPDICTAGDGPAADGSVPGVLDGCDFELQLGVGPDGGDWANRTPFTVKGTEPSGLVLSVVGLAGLVYYRRKRDLAASSN